MTFLINRIGRVIHRYPVSLIIIAVIIYLSLFNVSGPKMPKIKNLDKVAHFCMYAGFCSVLWLEYLRGHRLLNKTKIIVGAIIAPILFSGTMEIAQMALTENRSADWYDLLFNILGVFSAIFIGLYIMKPIVKKLKEKKKL